MRSDILLPLLIALGLFAANAQTITLTAEKNVYLEDDVRALHQAIFAPSGERVILHAVIDDLYWESPDCPLLTLLVRLPDGTERDDELQLSQKCSQDPSGRIEVGFDAGHITYWSGLGDYQIRLVLGGKYRDPKKTYPISNEVVLTMTDAALIERNWGPKNHGVAADLTLDKDTFALGEDVAFHIALENFDANVPIYGDSPLWRPLASMKLDVREANGAPLKQTCFRAWLSSGPSGLWRYPRGMIVPIERSLAGDGILPDHPGTFTASVTWTTFQGEDDACHLCKLPAEFDVTKPYAVAHSRVRTFKILDGPKPSTPCL